MTTTGCAPDISLAGSSAAGATTLFDDASVFEDASVTDVSSPPASRPGKHVLLSFAGTVGIGLTLGSWYLGARIVASDTTAQPIADQVHAGNRASSAPSASTSVQQAGAPAGSEMERYSNSVAVSPLYLQAAGIGPKQDASFARSLRAKGFHAQVQAIDAGSTRIVIGPFSSRAEMDQVRHKLQSAGVLAIESGN